MNAHDARRGLQRYSWALVTLLTVLFLTGVRSEAEPQESEKSDTISTEVAIAIFVALKDYQEGEARQGREATPAALARRSHSIAYERHEKGIEVHILEGTRFSFGGGVSYMVNVKDFSIEQKLYGR